TSAAGQFATRELVPERKAPQMTGLKIVMHGATQGSLNPSPTRSHSRATTSKLGRGITLSGMTRFAQIAVVPSPGPLAVRTHGGSGRSGVQSYALVWRRFIGLVSPLVRFPVMSAALGLCCLDDLRQKRPQCQDLVKTLGSNSIQESQPTRITRPIDHQIEGRTH